MKRDELLKVAKPILFNTEMVRAIQNGTKTATRRIAKPQPPKGANGTYERMDNGNYQLKFHPYENIYDYEIKPPYDIGDILYVRETFAQPAKNIFWYKADMNPLQKDILWKPSIHMPKEAARIFLRVTDIRLERLQDIEISDLQEEGFLNNGYVSQYAALTTTAFADFKEVWNSTIKKSDLDKYGWNANPLVWVIEFERVEVTE